MVGIKPICILLLFFLHGNMLTAQTKNTVSVQQIWTGYFNQSRISEKWGIWADLHLRTKEDFLSNLSQGIARIGLTYYLTDDAKLTAGYAFVNHFPADQHLDISQPEHRAWQQLQWHTRYKRWRLMQWFRLEERWRRRILDRDELASGYHFNFRTRYNFFSQFSLSKRPFAPKTLSAVINNEVHINFGKQVINNYFDQNRFFVGFNFHLDGHNNIQAGYSNVFQQLPAGNQYRSIHVIRAFYFHQLDLRKK